MTASLDQITRLDLANRDLAAGIEKVKYLIAERDALAKLNEELLEALGGCLKDLIDIGGTSPNQEKAELLFAKISSLKKGE